MFLGSFRRSVVKQENCELTANQEETMDNFTVETKKALWHVYDMLNSANSSDVHISQLKVITSNVGRILGFDSSEHLLDKDGMTSMDFDTYFDIVKSELILKQKTDSDCTLKPLGERLTDVMKTCWTFCTYERTYKSKALGSDQCLILWRLFNFFCETKEDGQIKIPIVLHRDEAAFICKEFIEETGEKNKEKTVSEVADISDDQSDCLKFEEFLNVFEKHFVESLSPRAVTYGLNQLYEKFILEILAKGMMSKRGFNVKNWKERYLVLSTKNLKYYVNQSQKTLKGTIEFGQDCEIEVPPERPGHKPNRFILHTPKKPYEMSAADLKTKHEWVSAFQTAIAQVGKETNIHQEAARQRCLARLEKKRQLEEDARKRREEAELLEARQRELDEEKRKRFEDEELLRARLGELEEEKRLRAEAEARAREEELLRKEEQERLRQLEAIKQELERLLAEERQAKKDEEIVRALQARLLEEEFQKREELERLKQEQEEILRQEREHKAVLQSDREEQERLLKEAKERLEQLERDRAAAADKMQEVAEKLQKAEKDRQIMEHKVKLWKTPVGLAGLITPKVDPLVTHRGKGAFCEDDFKKKADLMQKKDKVNEGGRINEEHEDTTAKTRSNIDSGVDTDSDETAVDNTYDNTRNESQDTITTSNDPCESERDTEKSSNPCESERDTNKGNGEESNLNENGALNGTGEVCEDTGEKVMDNNEHDSLANAQDNSDAKEDSTGDNVSTDINVEIKHVSDTDAVSSVTEEAVDKTMSEVDNKTMSEVNENSDAEEETEDSQETKHEEDDGLFSAFDNPIYDAV